jgi:FkbM family methyltransferase
MSLIEKARTRYFGEFETDLRYRVRKLTKPAVVSVGGVSIAPDSPLIPDRIRRLLYRGTYEHAEMELVRRHLAPDDRVLEVGACIGVVSSLAALTIGSDRVVTVEANPKLAPLIRETHRLNNVSPTLIVAMVDREEGRGSFFIDPDIVGSSSRQRNGAQAIEVEKISMQRLIAEHRPTFLIADVEGQEVNIFQSLDLSSVNKVAIELHPHIIGDEACCSVIDGLRSAGFVMRIDDIGSRNFYFERTAHGRHSQPA